MKAKMVVRTLSGVIWNWGVAMSVLFMFLGSNVIAQNVSVTDYKQPTSSADRLLIDLSVNHATEGDDTTSSNGNIGAVYKRFYDSLPFSYFIDAIGSGSVTKDIIEDEYNTDHNANAAFRINKYLRHNSESLNKLFASARVNANSAKGFDQPASSATLGVGYGRFQDATPLAKAVRIEDFLLKENEIRNRLPKEAMLELASIISRRGEYEDRYGDTYKKNWYDEMEAIIRNSGLLTGDSLGAIGILRMEEVLERERVADRFYGWDATVGARFDLTLPFDEQDRPPVNLDFSANYARPISWRTQLNERLSVNTPVDNFVKAYVASLTSDLSYELSNRIDFRIGHLLRIDKLEDVDAQYSNSLVLSLLYYLENYITLTASEQLEKTPGEKTTTKFTLTLNYRAF